MSQLYSKTRMIENEVRFCRGLMSEFSLILVLQKNKRIRRKTWRRYKLNLRDSLLLGDYFQSWSNLTPQRLDVKKFGLNATSRIKAFVFRFISVPAKWIRTSRRYVLNIYTSNNAYADVFQTDFG